MDPWTKAYVIFWFIYAAYMAVNCAKGLRERLDDAPKKDEGEEKYAQEEKIVTLMDQVLVAMSPQVLIGILMALLLALLAIDLLGLFLGYAYIALESWHLVLFAVFAVAIVIDHIVDIKSLHRRLSKIIFSDKDKSVKIRYFAAIRFRCRPVHYTAVAGRFIVALYLFMNSVFGAG